MDSHDIESYFRQNRKTLAVVFLAVGMLAVSGFFMGMRQTEKQLSQHPALAPATPRPATTAAGDIPVAPRYMDIATTDWKANRNWKFTLANLPRATKGETNPNAPSPGEIASALRRRSALRAYDGAPPLIPHAIDALSSAACASCHGEGETLVISGTRPAEISHPWITNCTSCHVPENGLRQLTASETSRLSVENSFVGKPSPDHGPRAYGDAPPTMPHGVWMRQNCMACHGPGREQAIRTSHPERKNCLQCHAPNARFDNRESYLTTSPVMGPSPPVTRK